jgi:membrane protein
VQETRPIQRRFSDYLSVVIVGPILLLAATSMTTSLQSQWLVKWLIEHTYLSDTILLLFRMMPYLFIWLAMIFLYIFIPNTRVRLGSAVVGGVLAGTAWQIAQWGYFHFQVGVANYNAIYGTMAALPVFLVWVYTSWVIVLFGLEVVYAHQYRATRATQLLSTAQTAATRDVLALSTLLLVCSHFRDNAPPTVPKQLSAELGIQIHEIEELLETLKDLHFLVEVSNNGSGWLPAREPSAIMLDEVLTALRGELPQAEESGAAWRTAIEVLGRESSMRRESLKGVTIHDLMMER